MAERVNLTKAFLAKLQADFPGQRLVVHDAKQPGLIVERREGGACSFYLYRRVAGRPSRIRLGSVADLSVENARKAAAAMGGDIARGVDPKAARHKQGTVKELFEHWLAHAKRRKKTWQADKNNFANHFKPIQHRPFATLKVEDVTRWHNRIGTRRGPYIANRCRALLSSMYGRAHELGFEGMNPCQRVERFPEQSRERFLRREEVPAWWQAVKNEPPTWRDFWLLCLFTGARRSNVAAMRWSELDLGLGVWDLTAGQVKGKEAIAIPLVPEAIAVLSSRQELRRVTDFVFPSTSRRRKAGHIRDPRKSWDRITKAAGLDDLRPHDLRRSLGSWQAMAGASLHVIGKSLGHRDTKSTAVYARLQLDPVRISVGNAVTALVAASESEPVKRHPR